MSETAKARKGDLILVECVEHNYYSASAYEAARAEGRELPSSTTTFEFGVVASATREGVVKTWHRVGNGDALVADGYVERVGYARRWVLSTKTIDVNGVLTAAKAHHWPNHPGQPMPFDSFEEAQAIARPHLLVAVRS